MITAIGYLLIGLAVTCVYSLILLGVFAGAAYRNGIAEGRRQAAQLPSNVRLLPTQRRTV